MDFWIEAKLPVLWLPAGLIAEQFLETTAAQLTYHGLCELTAAAKEGELSVFFRNNHFSTMTKHKVMRVWRWGAEVPSFPHSFFSWVSVSARIRYNLWLQLHLKIFWFPMTNVYFSFMLRSTADG